MNQNPFGPPPGGYGQPPPTPGPYGQPPPGGFGSPGPYGAQVNPYGPPAPPQMGMPGMPMMQPMMSPYGIDPVSGLPFSDKSKTVAGLLQLFAGSFGVGRFYTGHIGIAIAQIAVTWLTCGLGIFWPIIDGIMMLSGRTTDAQGRPLRD